MRNHFCIGVQLLDPNKSLLRYNIYASFKIITVTVHKVTATSVRACVI